jgi:hypothetical protein
MRDVVMERNRRSYLISRNSLAMPLTSDTAILFIKPSDRAHNNQPVAMVS